MQRFPSISSRPRRFFVLAGVLTFTLGLSAADTARRGRNETALDRYVAAPDGTFAWKKVAEQRDDGASDCTIDLVSQNWLTPAEVDRTEWRHWLLVVKPDGLEHTTALLFIAGGSNRPGNPPRPSSDLLEIARNTHSVVAELRLIPNQPLVFRADGRERKEDDLIAYTWDRFLRTGDERWPAFLPMTKAVVRAMDATTAWLASDEGGHVQVDTFVVAGMSKRGWTTWTTAAVDRRVVAICPFVAEILNLEVSMEHHYRAYGFYAPAVGDYTAHHIMDWSGTPEARALYTIVDPFSYRDRLTMPKLQINSCGDQFFLPDSPQFYFDALPGEKYLRFIPNSDHGLKNTDAFQTLGAWHHAILNHTPLPQFSWKHGANGTLSVTAKTRPVEVLLWQATNPTARDFRLETLGAVWKSSPVADVNGTFFRTVARPEQGWTAYFMELTFDLGASGTLKLTTDVAVTPDTLPFAAPNPPKPTGFLSAGPNAAP